MAEAEAKTKKKKGKPILLILGALLLLGGGIGGGLFMAGMVGGGKARAAVEKDVPKLVPKGSKKDDAEGGKEASSGGGAGGPKYESSYYQMDKEFTSNLRDSAHLIQVGIAVSTNYDARVIKAVQANELAVRSAVLMQLSETDEDGVFTAQGKQELQKRLVGAINQVLKEKEGFGGVGNVYFTNFIVQ